MVCPQYDMCQKCEEKRLHDATHPVVKLRVEMRTLPRDLVTAVRVADKEEMRAQELASLEAVLAKQRAAYDERKRREEAEVQVVEASVEEAKKENSEKALAKAAKKAEKELRKESRRKEKELRKALKKEKKTNDSSSEESVRVVTPPVSPAAEEVKSQQEEVKICLKVEVQDSAPLVIPELEVKATPIATPLPEAKPVEVQQPQQQQQQPVLVAVPVPLIPLALPVATPAQPVSLLAPELEAKLQTLSAMGFTDRQHTCMLLSRFDGNLQRVVEALLFV
jgi:uncharacterized protein YhaN